MDSYTPPSLQLTEGIRPVSDTADASDNVNAAKAIAKGLIEGHTPSRPGYWLHTGGTGILTYLDSEVNKTEGDPSLKVFDDWDGVSELVNLPPEAFHRNVDEIVLKTGTEHADSVKTAIVCPPTIYGKGRGPGSTRSRQAYELAKFILSEGYVPRVGRGLARWNNVHVYDVSRLFDALVNAAVDPSRADDEELWGGKGYYLCENGEHIWGELAEFIGKEVLEQGYLKEKPEVKELSVEEVAKSPAGFDAVSWGWNSQGTAHRARKILGWEPTERSIWDEVPDIVYSEAALLGR